MSCRKHFVKSIIMTLMIVNITMLIGCAKSTENNASNKIKIGVTVYDQYDTFIGGLITNLEQITKNRESEENKNIRLNIVYANGIQTSQNDQVDLFVEQGYDVICVNMVDRTAAATIIDKAKNANIPIIFFNREPVNEDLERWDKVFYVGADAYEGGILEGEIIADAYDKEPEAMDKNKDGILQYVIFEGEPGHQDALIRTESTIKTITERGITLEKIASNISNWNRTQAMTKMKQWIQTYGETIEVIISNNDDMALGAIDAYMAANIAELPPIVGIDATKPALEAVKEGQLLGTVFNDARGQAKTIFELAYALSQDESIEDKVKLIDNKYVRLPQKSIILENVDEYIEANAME